MKMELLLTAKEAARYLRISRRTIDNLLQDGRLRGYQIRTRGKLLFRQDDLAALLTPTQPSARTNADVQ
jgi:excisionase family DNA binding protein